MEKLKCPGCGAIIQTEDSNKIGYINKDVLAKHQDDFICERCFKLKNYNLLQKVTMDEEEFLENTKIIAKTNSLVVNIIDCFDLEGTVIKNINALFPNNLILIIANKYDLFLRSNRPTKIKKYINNYLDSLNIKTCGVIVTSSVDSYAPEKLYTSLMNICKTLKPFNNKVYFFGVTNVGKSSLISALKKGLENKTEKLLISNSVGTTLGFRDINILDLIICDTPGIINKEQITYYLDKETINFALPKKFVKPKSFQLNSNQCLFIEGFGWISYYGEKKCSFVAYFSNLLKLHRTKAERAYEFYELHKDDIFRFPNSIERTRLGELKKIEYKNIGDSEICLSGLGFIAFFGEGEVVVETFSNIGVSIRKQLI